MIHAFFLSLGQLFDRPILAVFVKSVILTLVLFAGTSVGLWFGMHALADRIAAWLGGWSGSDAFADIATILIVLVAHWLMFRAIAVAVIGIFADEVVAAVERKHYPGAHAQAHDLPFGRALAMGLGSALRLIGVNLLLSPLYLILLVTGVGTALAFFLVNSWLLGRDLGDMVAARHMRRDELRGWRRRTGISRFALGAAGTGLFLVPILNLVAPVLGAAMATHAFHRGRRA
ncbi:EI24 domain-containing protein [Sphingomonas sp. CBMAI 2297]|uniref:EI24 domain-containing protein n=1 Tax=Sphingomonas sp. CBMAI 2297 TaxID=2991720 RepID=UPI002459011C|nr:EI24 domain-containing protein [Sphingomonas sp. CBMAI 2297]MDH4744087.1 EI24 domain-containing protein [Sphingomonas sp. CBMAI 2297]